MDITRELKTIIVVDGKHLDGTNDALAKLLQKTVWQAYTPLTKQTTFTIQGEHGKNDEELKQILKTLI